MPPTVNPEDILPPETSPGEPSRGQRFDYRPPSRPSPGLLHLALPADPVSISVARVGLRRWLAGWSWPADQIDDIVLAVSEAASNAIEHAYLNQHPERWTSAGGSRQHRAGSAG